MNPKFAGIIYFYTLFNSEGITDGNRPGGDLHTEVMATWTPKDELKPTNDRPSIFPHTYYDYGGKTINITARLVNESSTKLLGYV